MSLAAARTIIRFDNQSVIGFIRLFIAIVYLDKKDVSSGYIVTDKQTTLEIIGQSRVSVFINALGTLKGERFYFV